MRLGPGILALLDEWERTRKHGAITLKFKAGQILDVEQDFNTHVKDLPFPASSLFPELSKPKGEP